MDGQKKTSGSLALNSTPRVITIAPSTPVRDRKLRVAAYARVSSSSEDQLNSFAAQNAHHTEIITANPEWEFVDVYADKGITGTSTEKRDDFQRLLADCRRGRVDKILVKSCSRFARNAKECLESVRELKALRVGVCFEEQGIDTSSWPASSSPPFRHDGPEGEREHLGQPPVEYRYADAHGEIQYLLRPVWIPTCGRKTGADP